MVNMPKGYHPNAYLAAFRNVKYGLKARTAILDVLEKNAANAKNIAKETGLSYIVVLYHLNLLERKGIVKKMGKRPFVWKPTGFGQTRLS